MRKSQPIARRSAIVSTTSSVVSPSPSISPLFVKVSGRRSLAWARTAEADLVPTLATDLLLESGDGLDVVVEDLGTRLEDAVDQVLAAVEIRGQHLDGRPGPPAHGLDAAREMVRAAVGQVVAGHGGDDDVPEPQPLASLGKSFGLVQLDGAPGVRA